MSKANEKLRAFLEDPKTIGFDEYCKGGPVPKGEEYLEEMARKAREKQLNTDTSESK